MRPHPAVSALAALAAMHAASPGIAQQDDSALSGRVALGLRTVDVDGSTGKYREDVNLDDGVRLFDVALDYAPDPGENGVVDRVELDARNLGGDPFESVRFAVRKYGAYDLELDRRRSEYFYRDVILPPALASIPGSTGGDFHTFDFERVRDRAALDVTLSPATRVSLALDRHTRLGESATTLDVERDEFELERPIDESMNAATVGVQHAWDRVTLIYERDMRDFENASELFLPGASSGQNQTDPAELLFFSLDQSYDYESAGDTLRVVARPAARVDLQAAWRREDLDLDLAALEESEGTSFTGAPFTREVSGRADIGRDVEIRQIDVGFGLNERLRLTGSARRLTLDQRGDLLFGAEAGTGVWDIETTGTELGVEYAASERLTLGAGVSTESRDAVQASMLASTQLGADEQTDRDGFFARLAFRVSDAFEIDASVEDDDIDDPYALSSPSGSRRYRLRGRYRWGGGLSLNASVRRDALENAASGWDADTDQASVRLAFERDGTDAALGLTRMELSRSILQLVTAGSRQDLFAIDYGADVELVDGHIRRQLNERLAVGGRFQWYENAGSFPLERDDFRGFAEIGLGMDYLVRLSFRSLDYAEDRFDDYDADIIELALELRW